MAGPWHFSSIMAMNDFPDYQKWVDLLNARDQAIALILVAICCALIWLYAFRPYPRLQRAMLNVLIVLFYVSMGVMVAYTLIGALSQT